VVGKALDWLDDRTGYRRAVEQALEEPVPGGASYAYVFGSVLTFILVLQATTGVFLAMYYSPSSTDAWASVAYIETEVTLGWFVRGLHSHGASAMVIVAGLHMLQTALYGAYKKPREVNWILGVLMLGLILAFALTGYLLPWDQTGYWATKVATGIAGTSPAIGEQIQQVAQGGNEYGNLTLTRFFAIHVFLLPGALIGLVVLHVALFRRHGVTPKWGKSPEELDRATQPFWPDQLFKDMVAIFAAFAVLAGYSLLHGGVGLDAPADPASNFDARPEWYFRPLFQMLKYFEGPLEVVVALGIPPVVGGFLLALPFLDKSESRDPRTRKKYLGILFAGFAGAAALTGVSFYDDASDEQLQERLVAAEERAQKALALAAEYGVPPEGGVAVFTQAPFYEARKIWNAECASCHQGEKRKAPLIAAGYNSRTWLAAFLKAPEGDEFFGRTYIRGMDPVVPKDVPFDALVEWLYAETGAADVSAALVEEGKAYFDDGSCSSCHARDGEEEDGIGPNLGGRGSRAMLVAFIEDPGHPLWFGDDNEMPAYAGKLTRQQVEAVAEYLLWLQSATPEDVKALE